jgi:hypothetical protein
VHLMRSRESYRWIFAARAKVGRPTISTMLIGQAAGSL